jgi:hypothetical protein
MALSPIVIRPTRWRCSVSNLFGRLVTVDQEPCCLSKSSGKKVRYVQSDLATNVAGEMGNGIPRII